MAYVSVDIDMSDIDTDELVDEVCRRIKKAGRKSLSEKEKKQIKDDFSELNGLLSNNVVTNIEINTLEDKIKYEHLKSVFNKYSSAQIEKLLP